MSLSALLMNVMIIVLLAVTIGYCWRLNRRIRILQDSKSELAQLLKHFDESTERASESIIALQTASKKIGENIQHRIDKANFLLDDLAFMIEKGNRLADQMEASFAVDRARNRVHAEDHAPVEKPKPLASRLEAFDRPEPAQAAPRGQQNSAREKTTASLEALLERVVGRSKLPTMMDEEELSAQAARAPRRSKSEQELLDMLKAGIKG